MPRPRGKRHGMKEREKSEFDQKVLDLRRTARVMAGGRRFSFRATVAIGNRNGKVGMGTGKGQDVSAAIDKAVNQAKKNLIFFHINKDKSVNQEVMGKSSAAKVLLKPAKEGHGLVSGGPPRLIAELGGVKNLTTKIIGRTNNKLNNGKAFIEALKKLRS